MEPRNGNSWTGSSLGIDLDRSVAQEERTGFIDWMIDVAYSDAGGGALPVGLFFMTCLGSVTVGVLGY